MAVLPPQILKPLLHSSWQILIWGAKKSLTPSSLEPIALDAAMEVNLGQGDDDFIVISSAQIEEITAFLADPAVVSLARLLFIRVLAPQDVASSLDKVANFPRFQGMVDSWCSERGQTWQALAEHLWFEIGHNQKLLLSNLRKDGILTDADSDALLTRFFFGQMESANLPEYIRLINELAQNPSRQQQINDLLRECDRQTRIPATDEFLVLGLEHDRAKFDELYVDRDLVDAVTGESISASQRLNVLETCPRVLVIGDPGVGKSTLMSWIRWKLLSASADTIPPIVITLVSRYDLTSPSSSVISAIIKQFETQFLVTCDEKTFAYLASVGWLTLIVDGIDEILDPTQRRKMVEQLNVLAQKYPALPIISTTRKTGFEISHFRTPTFDLLQLQQYSPEQVQKYASKWFSNSRTHLKADRFLGEIKTLGDLARNPLLLALLCTLYRQYDYIPESRRELYLRCASLMFYEWDPRRGIAIPNLFKREGEAILREISLILLRKGGVGSTIEEYQLVDVVKRHLEDKGLEPMAAVTAAHDLLDYCSKRAWIISKTGSRGDSNQFSFTHRTFFEFFASEAIIRNLNRQHALAYATPSRATQTGNLGPVSREILQVFEADHTSVMPELLLQAADDLMGGMSTAVLDELQRTIPHADRTRRSSTIALCIRLVAAGGAHSSVVERVFDVATKSWANSDAYFEDSVWPLTDFRALLNISAGYRAKFITRCMSDIAGLGRYFLKGYSRLGVIGETGLYSEDWRTCALSILKITAALRGDPFEIKYRWLLELLSIDKAVELTYGPDLLALPVEDYVAKGILWDAISIAKEIPKHVWDRAYKNLRASGGSGKQVSDSLVEFIETSPIVEQGVIPFKLAALMAALTWPNDLVQLARVTGHHPKLLELDGVFTMYDGLRKMDSYKRWEAERRVDDYFRRIVRAEPPSWLSQPL
jgi:hypothetical protein